MQKYINTVTDFAGNKITGALINVTDNTGGAVTLYSDFAGTTPIGSTLTSDDHGQFTFFAADGRYNISVSGSGVTSYTLNDVTIGDVNGFDARLDALESRTDVSVEDYGIVIGTDITASLQALINTLGPDSTLYFPPGDYTITDTITIPNNGVRIVGAGRYSTTFYFTPTADKECFKFKKGTSVIYECAAENFTLYSANGTYQKTGIAVYDSSNMLINNVLITNFYGKDSTGIRFYGRENNTVDNVKILADIGLRFSPNANTLEWLSIDHFVLRDSYFIISSAPTSGGTIPTTCILVDDKSHLSGFTMEGRNAFVSGQRGFYMVDTTSTQVSYMLELANFRREQSSDVNGWDIYISRTAASGRLQNVKIKNYYGGDGSKGIYARGIDKLLIENSVGIAQKNTVIDIDDVNNMEWLNFETSTTDLAKLIIPNMMLVKGCQKRVDQAYPCTASFGKKPAATYQQVPASLMNDAKVWEYAGTLANATQIQIPPQGQNGYKVGFVEVSAVATDGTEFEAGSWAIGAGANAGAASSNGVMKLSGSAKTTNTNLVNNLIVYCSNATPIQTGLYVYNRLGKDCYIVIKATFY